MKKKHMTLDDRIEIQECLVKGISFKTIGKRIEKSATTISREVKQHLQIHSNEHTKVDEVCPHLLKAPFVCNGCDKKVVQAVRTKVLLCLERPPLRFHTLQANPLVYRLARMSPKGSYVTEWLLRTRRRTSRALLFQRLKPQAFPLPWSAFFCTYPQAWHH